MGRSIKVEKLLCLKAKDTIITNIINQKAIEWLYFSSLSNFHKFIKSNFSKCVEHDTIFLRKTV